MAGRRGFQQRQQCVFDHRRLRGLVADQASQIVHLLLDRGEARGEFMTHLIREVLPVLVRLLALPGDFRLIGQHHGDGG